MKFTPKEVCEIVRKHLIEEWDVPRSAIGTVEFVNSTGVIAEVKTNEQLGGPYRSPPKPKGAGR